MKIYIRPAVLLASLSLSSLFFSAGCCMFKTAPPPTATLQNIRDDFYDGEQQAEATEDAVIELSVSPQLDMKEAYRTFCSNVNKMEKAGKTLVGHANGLHFIGPPYVVEPVPPGTICPIPGQQQIQREAQLGGLFSPISQEGWEVKRAYRAFQFDITSLHYYLCDNLQPRALDAIDPFIQKAQIDAESLIAALQRAMVAIDRAKGIQPQPPAGQSPPLGEAAPVPSPPAS